MAPLSSPSRKVLILRNIALIFPIMFSCLNPFYSGWLLASFLLAFVPACSAKDPLPPPPPPQFGPYALHDLSSANAPPSQNSDRAPMPKGESESTASTAQKGLIFSGMVR